MSHPVFNRLVLLTIVLAVVSIATLQEAEAQCGVCLEDEDITGVYHWFQNPDPEGMGDPHGSQEPGTCESNHNWCVAPEAIADLPSVDELLTMIASDNAQGLLQLLREQEASVKLNVSRRALQMLNCGGSVIVHVPLRDELLSTLTSEE